MIEDKDKFYSNNLDEIRERAQEALPIPDGYNILLKVYSEEEKTAGGIYLPESKRETGAYVSCVGLVLGLGPVAYDKGDYFKNWHKCNVGDWVIFGNQAGHFFYYRGIPLRFVADEHIKSRNIPRPDWIKPI